ncbi:response regulator [Prosthecodimorpha staleyi]|uniref:Response regulator n=1 Tax=Prosthecodimorpha staleyi TaxID=2840188 RepID=A0A947D0A2_9HYPH|nr:response regulator [Prosthecodimorpha staleyi]MBT9288385.1 response regulator [Prosthecodimorpha staleyi]
MSDRPLRIVYADDEEDILSVATLSLEMVGGHSVRGCRSGREAIEEALQDLPDVVMLDVMMPGMDGPSTMKVMRSMHEFDGLPIVLITARVRPSEVQEYLALGACGVITKPFDPMALPGEVSSLVRDGSRGVARARSAPGD